MPDLVAGTYILGQDTPPAVQDIQADEFTFTNTSLGVTTTGGTYVTCGVAFMAPTSGRVLVTVTGELSHSSSTGQTILAPVIREGGTVGSGTLFANGDPDGAVYLAGTTRQRPGSPVWVVTGLTAGATYNVRIEHRVGPSGTGTVRRRVVNVTPTS